MREKLVETKQTFTSTREMHSPMLAGISFILHLALNMFFRIHSTEWYIYAFFWN